MTVDPSLHHWVSLAFDCDGKAVHKSIAGGTFLQTAHAVRHRAEVGADRFEFAGALIVRATLTPDELLATIGSIAVVRLVDDPLGLLSKGEGAAWVRRRTLQPPTL